jgi:hypothetical protein
MTRNSTSRPSRPHTAPRTAKPTATTGSCGASATPTPPSQPPPSTMPASTMPASTMPASTMPASTMPAGSPSFMGNVFSTAGGVVLGQTIAGRMGVRNPAPAPIPASEKPRDCSALEKEMNDCYKVYTSQGDDRCRHIMERFKECLSTSGTSVDRKV